MVAVARPVVEQLHKQFKHGKSRETSDKDYLHVFTTTTMDPFSITIPTLPPFSLSSTPRSVPRKQRNIEDHNSPAKHIQENTQDSPSLACLESAMRFSPLSIKKEEQSYPTSYSFPYIQSKPKDIHKALLPDMQWGGPA